LKPLPEVTMDANPRLDATYAPSDDIVARDIDGELLIVPLTADVGDEHEALFTLNETGRAVWDRLDGRRSLADVARELSADYDASIEAIQADVLGLVGELLARRIVAEVAKP
jgi:hypothetical protein